MCISLAVQKPAAAVKLPVGCAVDLCSRLQFSPLRHLLLETFFFHALKLFLIATRVQYLTISFISFQDCKWKMYMELDGDEIAITYIKDVIFNANRQDVETLRMTKV